MIPITEGDQNLSQARAIWGGEIGEGRELVDRDADAYYHQVLSSPCLDQIIHAQGATITTADGRELLDFHGNSVHQVGFAHPHVLEAMMTQAQRLSYCTRRYTNDRAVELAERLSGMAPGSLRGDSRVLLTPSGSAAVGVALKIARACTGRYKTIAFRDSFHGATLDSAGVGGQELFHRGMGPLLPGVTHVSPPCDHDCAHCGMGRCDSSCACAIEWALRERGDIAAVIAEPVRATTVKRPPPSYWQRVREACDRHGTLLIFDEIPTSLGRTGTFWASEQTGVTPDLIVLGKGLGGAVYPQAAVVGRARYNELGQTPVRELALGHYTHEKSPIGAAVALATLDVIESERLVERAAVVGARWREKLIMALSGRPGVREIRQVGMMLGVQLHDPAVADRAMYESLRRGLSYKVGGGDTLALFPPLNIQEHLLDRATSILAESIATAHGMQV